MFSDSLLEVLLHIEFVPSLQNNVSLLLELWILKNLPDWQQLVPNTTLYLGARSLSEGSKVIHIYLSSLLFSFSLLFLFKHVHQF